VVAEYEVTVQLTRTARFRVMAEHPTEATAKVAGFQPGVRSMQDLSDDCELELDHVISTELVFPP
jgi:hypothetical protein